MNETAKQSLLSAFRSILIAVGAWMTGKGYADDQTVQTLIGAVMTLVPAAWGMYDKVVAERNAKAREVMAAETGKVGGPK